MQPCDDTPLRMVVLGVNAAGQSVIKAQVQTPSGVDNQLWRVTPSATFSFSRCHLQLELPPVRPFERWPREPLPYELQLPPWKPPRALVPLGF